MEVTTNCKVLDLETIWHDAVAAVCHEEDSLKGWTALDELQQTALKDLTARILDQLRQDLSWIPYTLKVEQGTAIDVNVRILFSDLTEEIVRRRGEEVQMLHQAHNEAQDLVKEFEVDHSVEPAAVDGSTADADVT